MHKLCDDVVMQPDFHQARFLSSVPEVRLAPGDHGAEVAFAGRSNAGKSSALNAITAQKSLARTSKTPGRTQQINFFDLGHDRRLVDLPGYGYARVPAALKQKWQRSLARYLETRQCLRGLVLLMDIRHPLTDYDRQMLLWCAEAGLAVHVLLTKSDKLKRGPAANTLLRVGRELTDIHAGASVQVFSALKRIGLEQARDVLTGWLSN